MNVAGSLRVGRRRDSNAAYVPKHLPTLCRTLGNRKKKHSIQLGLTSSSSIGRVMPGTSRWMELRAAIGDSAMKLGTAGSNTRVPCPLEQSTQYPDQSQSHGLLWHGS